MNPELRLGLSVAATGLWSGLLLTLTTIPHPMFAAWDAAGFTADLRRSPPLWTAFACFLAAAYAHLR